MEGLEKLKSVRIEKLEQLRQAGVNPYPYRYRTTHSCEDVLEREAELVDKESSVAVAGRLVALRGHGATTFGHIQGRRARLQFYLRRDELGDEPYRIFKLIEVGDVVGLEGVVFRTKTGEVTVRVRKFVLLSKALRPLPEKWHGLQDKELRYRQRYVDLIMNADVRNVFFQRSMLMQSMRQFLMDRGYIEVETPILQPIYGGASARPFITHHNALDIDLYLRIADELYLKRLLVGGFEKVFEFAKDFRNEGIDRSHNPEFTMMECYSVYEDYMDFMEMVEAMMRQITRDLGHGDKVSYQGHEIDFGKPWRRERFFDALNSRTKMDFRKMDEAEVRAAARQLKVGVDPSSSRARMLDDIFSDIVEPTLIQPTFIYDYPKDLSPLAKDHRSEEGLVERFEPFVCGFEVGNAFSELNDPAEQQRRFAEQAAMRDRGDEEAHMVDEDFVRALEYGMPPAAGLGIGVDRLTMVFTDSRSIRDVIFFPQMRPE